MDIEALERIKLRTIDIFGKLPEEVEHLFTKKKIDLLMKDGDVQELNERNKIVELTLGKEYINIPGIGNILFETLIPYLSKIKIVYANNQFKINLNKTQKWIDDLENILNSLVKIKQTHKIKEVV